MKKLCFIVASCIFCITLVVILFDKPYECDVRFLQGQDGGDRNLEIVRVSRIAVLRSGVPEAELRNIPFQDDKMVGSNSKRSNRFATAWIDGSSDTRYTVYITVQGDAAKCKVVRSK